jgi:hypothetical protein
MKPASASPPLFRHATAVIASVLFVAMAVIAIRERSPWYDEFYTYYVVRPGAPLSALGPAWLRDNHPPLFYALAWGWSRLTAPLGLSATVEGLRTINLVILAGTMAALLRQARRSAWWARIIWYDALALAAVFPAIDQIGQLRSYFLSFALTALALIGLLRVLRGEARASLGLGVTLALVFSVHLITTVIAGGLVAAAIVLLALVRRRDDALRLTLVAGLAALPFVLTMAVQLSTILANTTVFWIPGGFNAGRWAIEQDLTDAVAANPVLMLLALGGTAILGLHAWRRDAEARATLAQGIALGTGLAVALVVLMAIHLHRPLLITRYLVAVDPVVALILALMVEALTRRLNRRRVLALDGLALLAAAHALSSGLTVTLAKPGWDGTGRMIAAVVQQCPATRVYPNLHWNAMTLGMAPHDNQAVVPFAYRFVAQRFGFTLSAGHDLARGCPTLFWTEHVAAQHPTAQAVLDDLRAQGYPLRRGRLVRIGNGWVLVSP